MIVVYLFIAFNVSGSQNPVPPLADMDSCLRVKAAYDGRGNCVQALIPAPSNDARWFMPNRIGEAKK